MIFKFLKKIYKNFFLSNKIFQNFILKSFTKIILNKTNSRNYYIQNIDLRFDNDITNLIIRNINNSGVTKKFDKIYILTDLKININNIFFKKNKILMISSLEKFELNQIKKSFFFIVFSSDDNAIPYLKKIIENKGFFSSVDIQDKKLNYDYSNATSYRFVNSNCMKAVKNTFNKKNIISGEYLASLQTHENICEGIELTKNVDGDYVEIGVFEGGSALTALNYFKLINSKKKVFLLDTFEGFNYEESKYSSDVIWHESHFLDEEKKTKELLNKMFNEFDNYKLVTNNICKDDLPREINKISLANIDVDLYEATLHSLKKISKKISKNGIIMCEDPVNTPFLYGAYYAMDEFLKSSEGINFIKIFKRNHYFLIKQY